jgi:hypothetical protein
MSLDPTCRTLYVAAAVFAATGLFASASAQQHRREPEAPGAAPNLRASAGGPVPRGELNDNCATAPEIAEGIFAFDNTSATNDYRGTCGATEFARDIWWTYIPSASGTATWTTCGQTDLDTVLTVLTDCGAPPLVCADDSCGTQTSVTFDVAAGTPLRLRLAGHDNQVGSGMFTLSIDGPPSNDDCTTATEITEGTYPFTTLSATSSSIAACAPVGPDVWFRYTASQSGTATISTCGLSSLDTVLAVYPACGAPSIACNDNSCGLQSSVSFEVRTGVSYDVQVGGVVGGVGIGQVQIHNV